MARYVCVFVLSFSFCGCVHGPLQKISRSASTNKQECIRLGGSWKKTDRPFGAIEDCFARDAGKTCTISRDCQFSCVREEGAGTAKCSATFGPRGCYSWIDDSGREGDVICAD